MSIFAKILIVAAAVIYLVALLLLPLYLFRRGRAARGLPDAPVAALAFFTFGIAIIREGVHWLRGEPAFEQIATSAAICAVLFALALATWLAGYLFGRRKARHGTIVSGGWRNLR